MSAAWYLLPIGDGLTEGSESQAILRAFEPLFQASGKPPGMAVFKRFDSENRLQCEVTAYFSPLAAGLAVQLGARPCAKPGRQGLILLAGDEGCWPELFSETSA